MNSDLILPSPCCSKSTDSPHKKLKDEHIHQWKNQGFCFVSGLLDDALLRQLQSDALSMFPAPGTKDSLPKGFGAGFVFPSRTSPSFNELVLHENLLTSVGQLLGCGAGELRLTQAELWPKYGPNDTDSSTEGTTVNYDNNQDQRIHCDYPNHTLVHPPLGKIPMPWK